MSPQEWAAFAAEVGHAFRGDFGSTGPDDADGAVQEATYQRHLGELDYDVAAAAVALLVADGQVWLPTPGELVAAADRVTRATVKPFATALAVVLRLAQQHRPKALAYTGPVIGSEAVELRAQLRRQAARVAHAEFVAAVDAELGEGAARWADARGREELLSEGLEGEHAGAVRKRLADEFAEYVEQAEEDRKVGLAVARTQRALGTGDRPKGLRRMDGALGLPPSAS